MGEWRQVGCSLRRRIGGRGQRSRAGCREGRTPDTVCDPGPDFGKLRLRFLLETMNMNTYVTYLESALDGTRFEPGQVHTVHQGRSLWVRYDLPRVRSALQPTALRDRPPSLWRYRELLPLPNSEEPITLGEG